VIPSAAERAQLAALADALSVTNATTNEDTQTTSGLVVTPSAAERFHSAVAWSRVPGNTDPDLDPSGLTPLSRRDILVIN
jgi:hypothetical protein